MPSRIYTGLNEALRGEWTAAEQNGIGSVFIALQINSSHAGVKISGIEYGIEATVADQANSGLMALLVESVVLDRTQLLQPQLGITNMTSPLLAFERRYRYVKHLRNAPFDRSEIYNTPIEIVAGTPFAVVVATWRRDGAAAVGSVYPWLTVRGEMIGQSVPIQDVRL